MNRSKITLLTTVLFVYSFSLAAEQSDQKDQVINPQRLENYQEELTKLKVSLDAANTRLAQLEIENKSLVNEVSVKRERLAVAEGKLSVYESERSRVPQASEEAAKNTTFTAQIGVTMRSGETKPVTNVTVYLLKARLSDIASGPFPKEKGRAPKNAVMAVMYSVLFPNSYASVMSRVEENMVAKTTSDFSGRAVFEGIEPGDYVVFCFTPLGKGAVLEKSVRMEARNTMVSLGNEDILQYL